MPAGRGRKPKFYVYRLFDGFETLYVGKGSGRRLANQKCAYRCEGEVLECCTSDDHAFAREVHWIAQLRPTLNKLAGGNGGRCRPKPKPRRTRDEIEIERTGSRRYAARFLLSKLDERNCDAYGLSKVGLSRLREVANGPWC